MLPIGVRLWYADASSVSVGVDALDGSWASVPSTGLEALAIYFQETYGIWKSDGYDESGRPMNPRLVTENYRLFLCSGIAGSLNLATGAFTKRASEADAYWFDLRGQKEIGAGLATDVPPGLPPGGMKIGTLLTDKAFRAIYDVAVEDRVW